MDSETLNQFLDRRIAQMREGAREAIEREVAWLREHNFPVWVAENGHVVDASKRPGNEPTSENTHGPEIP